MDVVEKIIFGSHEPMDNFVKTYERRVSSEIVFIPLPTLSEKSEEAIKRHNVQTIEMPVIEETIEVNDQIQQPASKVPLKRSQRERRSILSSD